MNGNVRRLFVTKKFVTYILIYCTFLFIRNNILCIFRHDEFYKSFKIHTDEF